MEDNCAICYNCGAKKGLHSWVSDQCPKDGVGTPVVGKREWEDTIFEDVQQRKLQDAAPHLLEMLKEADNYLRGNKKNYIGNGSILHTKFKQAIKKATKN